MTEAILIGAVLVAALACPVMMWLGRRGIGPGCATTNCVTDRDDESLDALKQRQREVGAQVVELERAERAAAETR